MSEKICVCGHEQWRHKHHDSYCHWGTDQPDPALECACLKFAPPPGAERAVERIWTIHGTWALDEMECLHAFSKDDPCDRPHVTVYRGSVRPEQSSSSRGASPADAPCALPLSEDGPRVSSGEESVCVCGHKGALHYLRWNRMCGRCGCCAFSPVRPEQAGERDPAKCWLDYAGECSNPHHQFPHARTAPAPLPNGVEARVIAAAKAWASDFQTPHDPDDEDDTIGGKGECPACFAARQLLDAVTVLDASSRLSEHGAPTFPTRDDPAPEAFKQALPDSAMPTRHWESALGDLWRAAVEWAVKVMR